MKIAHALVSLVLAFSASANAGTYNLREVCADSSKVPQALFDHLSAHKNSVFIPGKSNLEKGIDGVAQSVRSDYQEELLVLTRAMLNAAADASKSVQNYPVEYIMNSIEEYGAVVVVGKGSTQRRPCIDLISGGATYNLDAAGSGTMFLTE